jgi:hypothetical protein
MTGAEIRGERRRPAHQEDRTQRDTHAQESQAPEPRQSHRGLQAGPAHFAVNLNIEYERPEKGDILFSYKVYRNIWFRAELWPMARAKELTSALQ